MAHLLGDRLVSTVLRLRTPSDRVMLVRCPSYRMFLLDPCFRLVHYWPNVRQRQAKSTSSVYYGLLIISFSLGEPSTFCRLSPSRAQTIEWTDKHRARMKSVRSLPTLRSFSDVPRASLSSSAISVETHSGHQRIQFRRLRNPPGFRFPSRLLHISWLRRL